MKVRRVCNVHDGGNNNIPLRYYELIMACCQVGLISSMDRALHPGITKFRAQFQVKPEFFQVLFHSTVKIVFTFILTTIRAQVRDMSTSCLLCLGTFFAAPVLISFHSPRLNLRAGKMK